MHDESKMKNAPRYENRDGEHLVQGSPKRGDPQQRDNEVAALRCSFVRMVVSVNSSDDRGCSRNYWIGREA
jgi:hypothetical protein